MPSDSVGRATEGNQRRIRRFSLRNPLQCLECCIRSNRVSLNLFRRLIAHRRTAKRTRVELHLLSLSYHSLLDYTSSLPPDSRGSSLGQERKPTASQPWQRRSSRLRRQSRRVQLSQLTPPRPSGRYQLHQILQLASNTPRRLQRAWRAPRGQDRVEQPHWRASRAILVMGRQRRDREVTRLD